jgi:erythromycin esterase-like protein
VIEQAEPGVRAVLWAHDFHVSKAATDGTIAMGQHLAKRFGKRYLSIGFAAGGGSITAMVRGEGVHTIAVGDPPAGGIDGTFARAGHPRFLLDLRAAPAGVVRDWLAAPQQKRSIGSIYTSEPNMDEVVHLSRTHDAIIFVDRTSASHVLE